MRIGSLFSGIGGLEHGLERAGLGEVAWQAEIDPYCRAVLRRHWPDAVRYDDVRKVDRSAEHVDLICGGFPCQPVSVAGARKGQADARWLWPEYVRIINELQPAVVVVENVPGLRTLGLRDVLGDLARLGFDAEWTCFGAVDIGAPHRRRRLFLVATHAERLGLRLEPGWFGRAVWEGAALAVQHGEEGAAPDAGGSGLEGPDVGAHEGRSGPVEQPGGFEADGTAAPDSDQGRRDARIAHDPEGKLQQGGAFGEIRGWASDAGWGHPPPALRGVDDGSAVGLDADEDVEVGRAAQAGDGEIEAPDAWRVSACGNAVVEPCAYVVGCAIREALYE